MLKLRLGRVVAEDPLTVEVAGERRRAWADPALVGEVRPGDEVVVNTAALDLGLGSGGFDVVHVNLTRGVGGAPGVPGGGRADRAADPQPHVMKLNYTSIQHPVEPAEPPLGAEPASRRVPVLAIPLHGHLRPAAWAAAQAAAEARVGYVQTGGGALPGSLSRDVAALRERGLLCGHVTAAPAFGGEHEAISLPGALDAAARALGWDAVIAGPGPGIIGSATRYGHGGIAALEVAHSALALGLPSLLSPRLSGADERPRHRGLSHHTETVLGLLLGGVAVAVPDRVDQLPPPGGVGAADVTGEALAALRDACGKRHRPLAGRADLAGYRASGLPARVMGRGLDEDPLFFAAALAAGDVLAALAAEGDGGAGG